MALLFCHWHGMYCVNSITFRFFILITMIYPSLGYSHLKTAVRKIYDLLSLLRFVNVYSKTGNRCWIHQVGRGIQDQIGFLVLASIHDWCRHKHIKLSQKQRCRDTNSIMDKVCIAGVRSLKADIKISWFTSAAYEIFWSLI